MGLKSVIVDAWSWLNYKPIYADPARGMPHRRAFPEASASWIPAADERRLAAYKMLAAYDNNQAGEIAQILDGDAARERREFGDPSMFIETLAAHVLGREQNIVVPGAAQATGDAHPGIDKAAAERVQQLLHDWAEVELLAMRMQQCERKAVSLGDGVYRLAWDPGKLRPTVRVTDPGFYFPVIPEDGDAGDYPDRVHFAWELPEDTARGVKARLRRITYELDWIRPATVAGLDESGRRAVRALPPPAPLEDGAEDPAAPVLTAGDVLDADTGAISRLYAWNDEPSFRTCYLTDATWLLEDLTGPADVDALPMDKATYATRSDGEVLDRLDLLVDFIPIIHVPNTVPPAEEHWGQPSIAKVLQVFDELASSDTDAARASATTGLPMIAISGVTDARQQQAVGPGMLFKLGENGKLTAIDTSPALQELREHRHDLKDRAANVARLPAVSMGTLDPSKVPSGYALQLSLGPLDSLIGGMRLARDHKYALLLKFVQRLYIAGQHADWAGVKPLAARMVFGPYTPTDKAAVLEQVTAAVGGGVMSLETGLRLLIEAGIPIEDAEKEAELIQSRQFEQARALADATGSTEAVADFLGINITPDPVPPAVQLPPGTLPSGTPAVEDDEDDDAEGAARGSGGNE